MGRESTQKVRTPAELRDVYPRLFDTVRLRLEEGWTYQQIAERVGYSASYIRHLFEPSDVSRSIYTKVEGINTAEELQQWWHSHRAADSLLSNSYQYILRFDKARSIEKNEEQNDDSSMLRLPDTLRVPPLAVWPTQDMRIYRAVELSLQARAADCFEGNLAVASSLYEEALEYARAANATLLVIYFQKFLGNVYEMRGDLTRASEIFIGARKTAREMIRERDREHRGNPEAEFVKRLIAQIGLRLLWVEYAYGAFETARDGALALVSEMYETHAHQDMPYLEELLARCAIMLDKKSDEAEIHIENAVQTALSLNHPRFAQYELYLDLGIAPGWQPTQVFTAEADILMRSGRIEWAFEAYKSVDVHRGPSAHWRYYAWFTPIWQDYLKRLMEERQLLRYTDPKLSYTFEQYVAEQRRSGHLHSASFNTYYLAESEREKGNLATAIEHYKAAMEIAEGSQAQYLYFRSAFDLSHIYAECCQKKLAEDILSRIRGPLLAIDSAYLTEEYQRIESEVARLEPDSFAS